VKPQSCLHPLLNDINHPDDHPNQSSQDSQDSDQSHDSGCSFNSNSQPVEPGDSSIPDFVVSTKDLDREYHPFLIWEVKRGHSGTQGEQQAGGYADLVAEHQEWTRALGSEGSKLIYMALVEWSRV
jgi:hypothetical protein